MTGFEIYKKALTLMGIREDDFPPDAVLAAIKEICADLGIAHNGAELFDEINADDMRLSALTYGVVMMLSLMNKDDICHSFFCELYNAKRAAVKSGNAAIKDVIPCDSGENV